MISTHDLLVKIAKRRAELVMDMSEGRGVQSMEDYRARIATIRALDDVVAMAKSEEKLRDKT